MNAQMRRLKPSNSMQRMYSWIANEEVFRFVSNIIVTLFLFLKQMFTFFYYIIIVI